MINNTQMPQIIGSNPLTNMMLQNNINPLTGVSAATTNFQPDLQVPPFPQMPQLSPVAGVKKALQNPAGMPKSKTMLAPAPTTLPEPVEQTVAKKSTGDETIMRVLANSLHNLTKLAVGNQDARQQQQPATK